MEVVWRERRRARESWVREGRFGMLGPSVEIMRVIVWMKRRRRWGVRKGLCAAVELGGRC